MPTIQFPAINGVDGLTCGVYAFGFTSACTFEVSDGVTATRGFTQEWYFDGEIGAWVSVTQGVTGGGADFSNAGPTYDAVAHAAPAMTGTGDIRQFAVLDPDTGGLTFAYIKTFDIVNPNESTYQVNNFSWTGWNSGYVDQDAMQLDGGIIKQFSKGTTLCAPNSHTYVFGSDTDSATGWQWFINRTASNDDVPSTFAVPPVNNELEFLLTYTDIPHNATRGYTVKDVDPSKPEKALPYGGGTYAFADYNADNGRVRLDRGRENALVGFTAIGGPQYESLEVKLSYTVSPGTQTPAETAYESVFSGSTTNTSNPRRLSHENWVYFGSITAQSEGVTDFDAALALINSDPTILTDNYRTTDSGNSSILGKKYILDPKTFGVGSGNSIVANPEDTATMSFYQRVGYHLSLADFGRTENADFYTIVAFPKRALPRNDDGATDDERKLRFRDGLHQIGDIGATGFQTSASIEKSLTNELGYSETYVIFCSVNPNGIGNGSPQFKLEFNTI